MSESTEERLKRIEGSFLPLDDIRWLFNELRRTCDVPGLPKGKRIAKLSTYPAHGSGTVLIAELEDDNA